VKVGYFMQIIQTPESHFKIRYAQQSDAKTILDFITSLAIYEHMADQVVATVQSIEESLFRQKQAEVIIGEAHDIPVAFALFYPSYSTFLGQANLFLEDLFVLESHRGKGYGKYMLAALAKIAFDRGCKRLDWWCLDWNTPSIEFYKQMGADHLKDWTIFRLQHDNIGKLASILEKK
jgi:GNAT superfamily N-acetyltransferase